MITYKNFIVKSKKYFARINLLFYTHNTTMDKKFKEELQKMQKENKENIEKLYNEYYRTKRIIKYSLKKIKEQK